MQDEPLVYPSKSSMFVLKTTAEKPRPRSDLDPVFIRSQIKILSSPGFSIDSLEILQTSKDLILKYPVNENLRQISGEIRYAPHENNTCSPI